MMSDLDEEIKKLDAETRAHVEETLKSINIALKLNIAKLKEKKIPPKLQRLMKWKDALEYWKERYGAETNDPELMAERVGVFYEICSTIK